MNRCKEVLGFDDTLYKVIGIPLISLIIPLTFYTDLYIDLDQPIWIGFIITLIYTSIIWFGGRKIIVEVLARYPIPGETTKSIAYQATILFVYVISVSLLGNLIENYFMIGKCEFMNSKKGIGVSLIISTTVVAIYEGTYLYHQLRKSLIEQERLQRREMESQLAALKSQINPHFLFNSLNTLAGLIPENTEVAVKYVENLSTAYRHILDVHDKRLITLKEELDFTEHYVNVLNYRFEDALRMELDVRSSDLKKFVLPLGIQMLIENAIKHNVVARVRPLSISIKSEGDFVVVRNNLQLRKVEGGSTQLGLKNIKERYRIIGGLNVPVEQSADEFVVKLPLINIESYKSGQS